MYLFLYKDLRRQKKIVDRDRFEVGVSKKSTEMEEDQDVTHELH